MILRRQECSGLEGGSDGGVEGIAGFGRIMAPFELDGKVNIRDVLEAQDGPATEERVWEDRIDDRTV